MANFALEGGGRNEIDSRGPKNFAPERRAERARTWRTPKRRPGATRASPQGGGRNEFGVHNFALGRRAKFARAKLGPGRNEVNA